MRSLRQDTAGDTKGHEVILMSENNKLDENGEQEKITIRPMDIAAGRKFSTVLKSHLEEGTGRTKPGRWTYQELNVHADAKTVERWCNGRNPPGQQAFDRLCLAFWPGPAQHPERDRFARLYTEMRTELNRRREAERRFRERHTSPDEPSAWGFFVSQSQKDCALLGKEAHAIAPEDLRLFETAESLYVHPSTELHSFCTGNPAHEYTCRADRSFSGAASFDELAEETGEASITQWIEKYRTATSVEIMERFRNPAYRHKPYNREQYGVRSINLGVAHEGHERSTIHIGLFRTDFFTNRVMRNIFHNELKPRLSALSVDDVPFFSGFNFSCLFTSIGVNTNVILNGGDRKELVLNKTALLANENQAFRWHVGMNEGINLEDRLGDADNTVSVRHAIARGLHEELGLQDLLKRRDMEIDYLSVFVTRTNMEIGIHAAATIACDFRTLLADREMHARDDRRESRGVQAIPFTPAEIKRFAAHGAEGRFVTYTPLLLDELMKKL